MHKTLSTLLVISFLALASLIPGGPVESRDFSHISPIVWSLFNFLLTVLGLGSLVFAFFVNLKDAWALKGGCITGTSYVAIYTLDLAQIFPTSPTPMPPMLELIEVTSVLLGLLIVFLSAKLLFNHNALNSVKSSRFLSPVDLLYLLFGIALIISIVVYSTLSAMGIAFI